MAGPDERNENDQTDMDEEFEGAETIQDRAEEPAAEDDEFEDTDEADE